MDRQEHLSPKLIYPGKVQSCVVSNYELACMEEAQMLHGGVESAAWMIQTDKG